MPDPTLFDLSDELIGCTKCYHRKTPVAFRLDPKKTNGRRSICKECDRAAARAYQKRTEQRRRWRVENPERWSFKQREHMLRRYGLTVEEYADLLAGQDGCCAICKSPDPRTRGRKVFAVDHDHATGAVRGLLCMICNTGIGGLADNPVLVAQALAYLLGLPEVDPKAVVASLLARSHKT